MVCDTAFDEEYSYLIGTDNYEAGVIAGEYLAGYIKENWDGAIDYLVLEYYQSGGEHVKDRMQGCVDGLRDNGIDLTDDQVVWFDNEAQTQKTNQITRDFLTAQDVYKRQTSTSWNSAPVCHSFTVSPTFIRPSNTRRYTITPL